MGNERNASDNSPNFRGTLQESQRGLTDSQSLLECLNQHVLVAAICVRVALARRESLPPAGRKLHEKNITLCPAQKLLGDVGLLGLQHEASHAKLFGIQKRDYGCRGEGGEHMLCIF